MSEIWNLSTLCRCCHADGYFKSLNLSYQGKEYVEIYEIMLRETLGITISTPPLEASYTICDKCILKLRDATDFKNQVLACEQKFQVYCNNEQFVSTQDVKLEAEKSDDGIDHDDDSQMDEKLTLDVKKEYSMEVDIKHPIEEVKSENQPLSDKMAVFAEKIIIEDEIDNKLEVPKKNRKNTRNNRQRPSTNKTKRKPRVKLDLSLIIQVDTDTGTQYSCKDCGGCYHTQKEINRHIYKAHAILFKCEYCPKQLKCYNNYKNHMRSHTGNEMQCSFCPKKFITKHALKEHLNCHTRERIYKCDLCQKDFKYKQTLAKHLKVHAGTNKKKLCDLCGRSFNDQSNLDAHVRTVHQKLRPYHCKLCGKTYTNKRHLKDHLKSHDGDDNIYKCDVCDHRLSCPKSMKIHRLKHDNKFMCKYCSKIFDDAILKKEHVRAMHHANHSCSLCGKIFAGKYSLNRHIDDHKGIKKFPCDVCGLKFSQKAVLDRHIFRKHNPEADINIGKTKCDICKRSYKNIAVHVAIHSNRKFSCEICGKTYPDNSALNRHKSLKHFGRTFDCDLCDKKYLQKGKLNTHRLKIHKIKIEKVNADSS